MFFLAEHVPGGKAGHISAQPLARVRVVRQKLAREPHRDRSPVVMNRIRLIQETGMALIALQLSVQRCRIVTHAAEDLIGNRHVAAAACLLLRRYLAHAVAK